MRLAWLTDVHLDWLEGEQVEVEVRAGAGDGRLLAFLAEKGRILSREYPPGADEVRIVARLPQQHAERLRAEGRQGDEPLKHALAVHRTNGKNEVHRCQSSRTVQRKSNLSNLLSTQLARN